MSVTIDECFSAIKAMRDVIPFFPQSAEGQTVVIAALASMVSTKEQLDWLVVNATNRMKTWLGLAELRGVFCSRFKPADGIETDCGVTGFAAEDCEAEYQRSVGEETQRKIEGWKQEQKKLRGNVAIPAEQILPIPTDFLDLSIPCPACKSTQWKSFAVPGTFEVPGGWMMARCENNHDIDISLLKSGKFGKFIRREELTVDEQQLEALKRPAMSEAEKERKLADLKAALRQAHPERDDL